MKIDVKFTDSSREFKADFGEVHLVKEDPEAIEKAYADGKEAERTAFWGVLQNNGKRTDYSYAFYGANWDVNNFKPVFDIKPTSANSMFRTWNGRGARSFDLVSVLEKLGVTLDFSNCTNMSYAFNSCTDIEHLGVLDIRKVTTWGATFAYSQIRTIDKMIVAENTDLSSVFTNHSALRGITFEGVIGKSANFQWCTALTVESMKNIISCLKNHKGLSTEYSYILKFPDARWEALEADSTSPTGGLWRDYVFDLGWNY